MPNVSTNQLSSLQKKAFSAARNGNALLVALLCAADEDLLIARDKDGSTLLHCAAWRGHVEVVRTLVQIGAALDSENSNEHWGTTPLHAAAHANHSAVVQLLLESGASVNVLNLNGRTALDETVSHKATAAERLLEKHGAMTSSALST